MYLCTLRCYGGYYIYFTLLGYYPCHLCAYLWHPLTRGAMNHLLLYGHEVAKETTQPISIPIQHMHSYVAPVLLYSGTEVSQIVEQQLYTNSRSSRSEALNRAQYIHLMFVADNDLWHLATLLKHRLTFVFFLSFPITIKKHKEEAKLENGKTSDELAVRRQVQPPWERQEIWCLSCGVAFVANPTTTHQ